MPRIRRMTDDENIDVLNGSQTDNDNTSETPVEAPTAPISSKVDTNIARVTTRLLNIRKEPDITSDAIDMYSQDEEVKILSESGGWYKTDKGWIKAEFTERV